MENNLYNSGLDRTDWYLLKNAILDASYNKDSKECQSYIDLPEDLKNHAVGQLIKSALYEDNRLALGKAAKIMVDGNPKAWTILEKL